MDLLPYLKLLVDKNASELTVIVGSPITVKISGKNKPAGKTAITTEMAKSAAFALMSNQ